MLDKLRSLLTGTLRRQLVWGVALVHALMMSLFIWDLTLRQQDMLLAQKINLATSLATSISTSSAVWVSSRDIAGLQEVIDAQLKYADLKFAIVVDQHGAILAHTDRKYLGMYMQELPARVGQHILSKTEELIDVLEPVNIASRHVGWVRVGLGEGSGQALERRIVIDGLLYALAAIALGVILAALMASRLTRRLNRIQAGADAVQRGDTDIRVRLEGSDEAYRVGQQFDSMLDALAQRERELRHSRDQLQLTQFAFEHSHEGAFWLDKNGKVVRANLHACNSLGYTREEMMGMHAWEFDPDFPESTWQSFFVRLQAEGTISLESRHCRKDGFIFPIEVTATYLNFDGMEYSFALVRDISERKMAERILQERMHAVMESEERFRATFNQAAVGIAHLALDEKTWLRANSKFCDILGYRWEELQQHTLHELTYADDLEISLDYANKLLAGKLTTYSLEKRYMRRNDTPVWVNLTVSMAYDEHGPAYLIKVIEDITVRKVAENKLRHTMQLYKLLSEANAAIARIHESRELMEAVCKIAVASGFFRMAWVGMLEQDTGQVLPFAQAGHVDEYLNSVNINIHDPERGKGPIGTVIRENRHVLCGDIADDTNMAPWRAAALQRGYRSSAVFPLSQEGRVVGTINLYRGEASTWPQDIIELLGSLAENLSFALNFMAANAARAQTEDELRELNVQLEQRVEERTRRLQNINQELVAFSYSVSHDLRAPLRGIDGFSQMLLKDYADKLDDKGKDYLNRVRKASQRMGELIDDMLMLSRVTRSELNRQSVDLSQMVREIVAELANASPERKVEVKISEGLTVHADAKLMRIAMDNLLGNAWKFTGKKIEAKIEFGTTVVDGTQAMYVKDNGAGFKMAYVEKLFGAFQRLHGVNEFEGSGIGLATVRRIMQRHGGRVWAEGAEGAGAIFYFTCVPDNEGAEHA